MESRLFEAGVIPGPLQTREYALALAEGAVERGVITPEQAEERVAFHEERQTALVRTMPPLVIAVLDESCVRRPIGGPAAMDAQLQHLISFAPRSNTMLQLAPYSTGERRPFNRAVNPLTLQDRSVFSYVESETQGYLDRELASVVPLVRALLFVAGVKTGDPRHRLTTRLTIAPSCPRLGRWGDGMSAAKGPHRTELGT